LSDREIEERKSFLPDNKPAGYFLKRFEYSDNDTLNCTAILGTSESNAVLSELDQQRKFTIRMYLKDETIAIYEKGVENSGIASGKFLERSRIQKPRSNFYYAPKNLLIGTYYLGCCLGGLICFR
jgi:hypothetical protein